MFDYCSLQTDAGQTRSMSSVFPKSSIMQTDPYGFLRWGVERRTDMATLQRQIADKFLEKLAHAKDVDAAQLDGAENPVLGQQEDKGRGLA